MTRPKKTPEPAKRGPGRPRGRKPVDPRVRISPEVLAALMTLPGGTVAEHVERALGAYLGRSDELERAYVAGLESGRAGWACVLRAVLATLHPPLEGGEKESE